MPHAQHANLVQRLACIAAISSTAVADTPGYSRDASDGAAASAVLLGRGNSMVGWTHAWNTPSPGNSLSVSEHELAPWSGLPFFNISYNFTGAATNDEWLTLGTNQGYVNTAPGMPLLAVPGVVGQLGEPIPHALPQAVVADARLNLAITNPS